MKISTQSVCIILVSSSSLCVSQGGQLYEGRHRRTSWMGCSCPHLSHKTCQKCGKECKVKKHLWVKNVRSKLSARSKNVTKEPGKSKATKNSQDRAKSWWRPSRAWEARMECRWQGKVAPKSKSFQWGRQQTTNITKTSWRFFLANKKRREKWLRYLFKKNGSVIDITFISDIVPHMVMISTCNKSNSWCSKHIKRRWLCGDTVDTPKEGIGEHRKWECLKSVIGRGKAYLLRGYMDKEKSRQGQRRND